VVTPPHGHIGAFAGQFHPVHFTSETPVSDPGGVHNERVSLSMTSERDNAPVYRLVRWMLLALVAAGVIGMHVLSEQDTGGGHGMVMDAGAPVAAMGPSASAMDHQAMIMTSPSASSLASSAIVSSADLLTPARQGMSGAMAMCLLFLATGAAALTLALLAAHATRRAADLTDGFSVLRGVRRRGPPLPLVDSHLLCIWRV
jgi:hypothetical protein